MRFKPESLGEIECQSHRSRRHRVMSVVGLPLRALRNSAEDQKVPDRDVKHLVLEKAGRGGMDLIVKMGANQPGA